MKKYVICAITTLIFSTVSVVTAAPLVQPGQSVSVRSMQAVYMSSASAKVAPQSVTPPSDPFVVLMATSPNAAFSNQRCAIADARH